MTSDVTAYKFSLSLK